MRAKKSIKVILSRTWVLTLLILLSSLIAKAERPVIVINPGYRLVINSDKGTIESFSTTRGIPEDLLIPNQGYLPLFKIEFRVANAKYRTITSLEAKKVSVNKIEQPGSATIILNYEGISDLNINATVTIRCPDDEPLTYWSFQMNNPTNMWISHIQFPLAEVPFDQNPTPDNESHILYSLYDGVLVGPVQPGMVWEHGEARDMIRLKPGGHRTIRVIAPLK